jgi:hypothetical protein
LFMAPPRALEGARASEGSWILSSISFKANPPLLPKFPRSQALYTVRFYEEWYLTRLMM